MLEQFLDDNNQDVVIFTQGNRLYNPEWEIAIRNSLGTMKYRHISGFNPNVKYVYKAAPLAPLGLVGYMTAQGEEGESY